MDLKSIGWGKSFFLSGLSALFVKIFSLLINKKEAGAIKESFSLTSLSKIFLIDSLWKGR
jgi:hypothetical protein